MYKKETKDACKNMYKAAKEFDKQFTELKIAIHTLDKIGYNMDQFYEQLENLGIELYKTKMLVNAKVSELI